MFDTRGSRPRTVLFAGGGTGGHLMPGLSVGAELRRRMPESRAVFVGTSGELERDMVESRAFEFHALPSPKWIGSAAAPRWALRSVGGLLGARKLVQRIQPDIVVSLGGHAALAPSLAGRLADVPLVIMEQNAYPGKANRLLSWWAQEVYAPWPGTETFFAYPDRVHITGNPVRRDLGPSYNRRLAVRFGLSPRKKTLFVTGGSQGARFINRTVIEALPQLENEAAWLQILHSAGRGGYEEVRAAYARSKLQAAVFPFIDDMASAYAVAGLALCRAGGTTLAELTVQGVPAVMIPLPTAANDHQRRNASRLAGEGAALMVDQADLTPERLADTIVRLLRNEPLLTRMREASVRLGFPTATRNVVSRLCNLLRDDSRSGRATPVAASFADGG